ncbi:hypothetical protein HBH98_198640 [Parastagonospora nodorum]|nr:hypothetical protein HBH53_238400 [Parastagonospora nodorum]KAH3957127.1 hypothetical protein HBH51_229940 [Parastagonospora nodorum]KAH4097436.1 hypothetical protein HBH46_164030 [Parastagonospora nodorum]KAH4184146.1 hypothetical protein HBH42_192260 [Parastagonospora nodorum]KAH4250895.1 hypothetical protein HBI03_234720 [Parastagonospora nodorum]
MDEDRSYISPSAFQFLVTIFKSYCHSSAKLTIIICSSEQVMAHILSDLKRTPTTGFQRLPLEMRNKIYLDVVDPVLDITIPLGTHNFFDRCGDGSWRKNLDKRLPPCLILSRQIKNEAIEEMHHSAMQLIKKITLSDPDDLLKALPATTKLNGLHELVLTGPRWDFKEPFPSNSIRDILLRCPHLQELTITIPVSVFSNDYESYFGYIFEHGNLNKLTVNCHDAPQHPRANNQWWCDDYTLPRPFERWFLDECEKRRRGIALSVDLSPGQQSNGGEHVRKTKGNIKYMYNMDWFG